MVYFDPIAPYDHMTVCLACGCPQYCPLFRFIRQEKADVMEVKALADYVDCTLQQFVEVTEL